MLRKTFIATAVASLVGVGALAATTGTASAASIKFGGPGWGVTIGTPSHHVRPHLVCKPIFKKVKYWKRGKLHTRFVKIGENCYWVGGHAHGPWGKPAPWSGQYPW